MAKKQVGRAHGQGKPAKPALTVDDLCREAMLFSEVESKYAEPSLYGVTDGKAVGTYVEQKFRSTLEMKYNCGAGNSAKGIDLPAIDVDLKVTSIKQPQSSCPFRTARQKIYGRGIISWSSSMTSRMTRRRKLRR
jgi:hypothetical protein